MTLMLTLCDFIFDHFPLFDETLRHIEICKYRHQSSKAKSVNSFLIVYWDVNILIPQSVGRFAGINLLERYHLVPSIMWIK